jgi:hypothetical protein
MSTNSSIESAISIKLELDIYFRYIVKCQNQIFCIKFVWPVKLTLSNLLNLGYSFNLQYLLNIEHFDEPLIFTSHLYTIYKHMIKFRSLSKSSIQ